MYIPKQRLKVEIPEYIDPKDYKRIGRDIITYIQQRAIDGTGFNPETGRTKKFPGYTKKYAEKKGQTNVDLILDGDMFNAMDVTKINSGSIEIGFTDSEENAKAHGNQTGSYGKPSPDPSKARYFLGLTKKELEDILEDYK